MSTLREGWERFRHCFTLESELRDSLVGTTWHIPIIEWEERQQLKQRGDYPELMGEFYGNPEDVEVPVPHENFSYEITDIEVNETGSDIYKIKRILGKAEFKASIQIDIVSDEAAFLQFIPQDHPLYEELDLSFRRINKGDGIRWYYDWDGLESFQADFGNINRVIAETFSRSDTIDGLKDEPAKVMARNTFEENYR